MSASVIKGQRDVTDVRVRKVGRRELAAAGESAASEIRRAEEVAE